jgi:hypothetical protein
MSPAATTVTGRASATAPIAWTTNAATRMTATTAKRARRLRKVHQSSPDDHRM